MRALVFVIATVAAVGCRKPAPPSATWDASDPLAALSEPVSDPLRARFSFKIASEPLGLKGSTGGALIVDRPGRLHFAVLGPLGSALATAQTDGDRASIVVRRDQQHYWAEAVEATVREWTGDELGVDGVVGLFLGQVPLPASPRDLVETPDGSLAYTRSPRRSEAGVAVVLDGAPPRPREVRIVDADGTERLALTYEGFEAHEAGVLPTGWALSVPELKLSLDVRFKSFDAIEQAPEVFETAAPDGFSSYEWAELARAITAPR